MNEAALESDAIQTVLGDNHPELLDLMAEPGFHHCGPSTDNQGLVEEAQGEGLGAALKN